MSENSPSMPLTAAFTDVQTVTLLIGSDDDGIQELKVDRDLLSAHSGFFRRLFASGFQESYQTKCRLPDDNYVQINRLYRAMKLIKNGDEEDEQLHKFLSAFRTGHSRVSSLDYMVGTYITCIKYDITKEILACVCENLGLLLRSYKHWDKQYHGVTLRQLFTHIMYVNDKAELGRGSQTLRSIHTTIVCAILPHPEDRGYMKQLDWFLWIIQDASTEVRQFVIKNQQRRWQNLCLEFRLDEIKNVTQNQLATADLGHENFYSIKLEEDVAVERQIEIITQLHSIIGLTWHRIAACYQDKKRIPTTRRTALLLPDDSNEDTDSSEGGTAPVTS